MGRKKKKSCNLQSTKSTTSFRRDEVLLLLLLLLLPLKLLIYQAMRLITATSAHSLRCSFTFFSFFSFFSHDPLLFLSSSSSSPKIIPGSSSNFIQPSLTFTFTFSCFRGKMIIDSGSLSLSPRD